MQERRRFERELCELGLTGSAEIRWARGETTPTPIRLTHLHVRKALLGGTLVADTAPGAMDPTRMRPGYVAVAHPARQSLQKAVDKLINDHYLAAVVPNVHLRLALVDLTGLKLHAPVFSGFWAFGGHAAMEGASLTKILALYALLQLRFDLNARAKRDGIISANALITAATNDWTKEGLTALPKFKSLFKFIERAGQPVVARIKVGTAIHHNYIARGIILLLGFEYIGSVALQSGLYDETQGGLWLNSAYLKPRVSWTTSPFPHLFPHNATALAVATFFTLLAQGRLADQATSDEIATILKAKKCMDNGQLDGINTLSGTQRPSANKCGIGDGEPLFHDAILVHRKPGARDLAYAVALLTREPPALAFPTLGKRLDALIDAANP